MWYITATVPRQLEMYAVSEVEKRELVTVGAMQAGWAWARSKPPCRYLFRLPKAVDVALGRICSAPIHQTGKLAMLEKGDGLCRLSI